MIANMAVPFLDLVARHTELEEQLVAVFRNSLKTASFIGGPIVEQFEHEFAEFCGTKFCIGVGSGTDAVRFALMAAGVRAGESVITVPNTFIATTEAISQAGAVPEFVEIDERTYNMDPQKLRQYIERNCEIDRHSGRPFSRRTGRIISAVVPVHLYGQPADMDAICEVAEAYNLIVVEDACQAHGAEYFSRKEQCWKKAGSMGSAAAFSFYPGKNLGACGEAGAVTTNDEQIARTIRMIRDHGQSEKYRHDIEGYNGRLDTVQAGLLSVKLPYLAKWNAQRRELAAEYRRLLNAVDCGINPPFEPSWSKGVYHLYVVRTDDREGMMNHLKKAAIATAIHYPTPLHLQKAYSSLNYRLGDFPVAEKVATQVVSLPMFPQLSGTQQIRVVEEIVHFLDATAPVRQDLEELVFSGVSEPRT